MYLYIYIYYIHSYIYTFTYVYVYILLCIYTHVQSRTHSRQIDGVHLASVKIMPTRLVHAMTMAYTNGTDTENRGLLSVPLLAPDGNSQTFRSCAAFPSTVFQVQHFFELVQNRIHDGMQRCRMVSASCEYRARLILKPFGSHKLLKSRVARLAELPFKPAGFRFFRCWSGNVGRFLKHRAVPPQVLSQACLKPAGVQGRHPQPCSTSSFPLW